MNWYFLTLVIFTTYLQHIQGKTLSSKDIDSAIDLLLENEKRIVHDEEKKTHKDVSNVNKERIIRELAEYLGVEDSSTVKSKRKLSSSKAENTHPFGGRLSNVILRGKKESKEELPKAKKEISEDAMNKLNEILNSIF